MAARKDPARWVVKSMSLELGSLRGQLAKERAENRRRNGLFDRAIRSNDLREVAEDMYRYFYERFGVYKGDLTILADYDEREFYSLIGWTPRDALPTQAQYHRMSCQHCDYLRGLVEEQIFVGYHAPEKQAIQESRLIEQSTLECMVTKKPRIVNDVAAELSPQEQAQARKQQTRAWLNWVVLHPENAKLLAKMHMSFRTRKRYTMERLGERLGPFENLLRYRILHTRDYKRVKYLSERDALTGFFLRPVLADRTDEYLEAGRRRKADTKLTVCMIDLDFFKRFNDRYGHDVGDRVLRRFAAAVQATLRETDIVGRYGGEEFVALFPDASTDHALAILRRLHDRVKAMNFLPDGRLGAQPEPLRFSAGVVTLSMAHGAPRRTFEEVIKAADDLLLHCKGAGRNCCAWHDASAGLQEFRFEFPAASPPASPALAAPPGSPPPGQPGPGPAAS